MRLPIDGIEDLRIAVDEAFVMLSSLGTGARYVTLELESTSEVLRATMRMTVDRDWPPPGLERTLAWKVMVGLTDGVEVDDLGGEASIALIKRALIDG